MMVEPRDGGGPDAYWLDAKDGEVAPEHRGYIAVGRFGVAGGSRWLFVRSGGESDARAGEPDLPGDGVSDGPGRED